MWVYVGAVLQRSYLGGASGAGRAGQIKLGVHGGGAAIRMGRPLATLLATSRDHDVSLVRCLTTSRAGVTVDGVVDKVQGRFVTVWVHVVIFLEVTHVVKGVCGQDIEELWAGSILSADAPNISFACEERAH